MAKLYKIPKSQDGAQLLLSNLKSADSLWERGKGLLGRSGLEDSEGLWFTSGNNIHTFFMKFTIDCIFLDQSLKVVRVFQKIKPFRFVGPVWKARAFVEVNGGSAEKWQLEEGDQLYVVS